MRVLYHSALEFSLSREFYHDENVCAATRLCERQRKTARVSTTATAACVCECVFL